MANPGLLRIVSNSDIQASEKKAIDTTNALSQQEKLAIDNLVGYLNRRWFEFRNHNRAMGTHDRCIAALRAYHAQYSPAKLQEIKQFGGSEVYSGISSVKCRAATALLRDVFLTAEKSWGVSATAMPELPDDIAADVNEIVLGQALDLQQQGVLVTASDIQARSKELLEQAARAQKKTAQKEAKKTEDLLQDVLQEGGFYSALAEFLVDLPIFPYAVLKGPTVKNVKDATWINGKMTIISKPKFTWARVSPMDIYFAPGADSVRDAGMIEHLKINRSDLSEMVGLPGYNEEAIRNILREYVGGWYLHDSDDPERARIENRENPSRNESQMLDGLEWNGPVPGRYLLQYGFTKEQITEPEFDYHVVVWWIGRHVIKVQINPNPKKSHPYYVSSFEKVPGSIIGRALPEIIGDIEAVANAALRSLVNNMAIASGPQVAINEDRLSPNTDGDSLFPWKRWRFLSDPFGNNQEKPIDFFQPQSNAQELLGVYTAMVNITDEISAIPKYLSGSEKVGGAARTASGLSMLINNASKMLQSVAANIDHDILELALRDLYLLLVLTDRSGELRGDADIVVKGVSIATQQETLRLRKLEYLQMTSNPIDSNIMGAKGRGAILRSLAHELDMPGDDIVPTEDELVQQQMQQQQAQMMEQQAKVSGQGARPEDAIVGVAQANRAA